MARYAGGGWRELGDVGKHTYPNFSIWLHCPWVNNDLVVEFCQYLQESRKPHGYLS
jgi:hypothetical protein